MRLQLIATPDELQSKGSDLIKALADKLSDYDPELGEALIKAIKVRNPESDAAADNLTYPVLRELKRQTTDEYKRQLRGMLEDIEEIIEGKPLKKAFGDPPEEKEPGEEPEEKPEPGEYDPKIDDIVPEPEEEDEEDEDEEEEKAMVATGDTLGL